MTVKALVIDPKNRSLIPRHELIRMAGAKAKETEGKPNDFYAILSDFYVPELHVYVVLYDDVVIRDLLLEEKMKEKG